MLENIIIIAAAVIPSILLGIFIWRKDTKKEPFPLLLKAFFYGALICFPVASIELGIESILGTESPSNIIETTINAFFVAAIPEEAFKLLILWWLLRKNPYFDEHFDGIVYAVFVGLGFATLENIGYVLSDDDWASVAIARALLAVPGHYVDAVLMGYYYSLYKFVDPSPKSAACILLVPVLAHGVYDSIAMASDVNPYIGTVCFILLVRFCIWIHKIGFQKLQTLMEKDKSRQTSDSHA